MIHEFPTPIFHVKCKNWESKKKYILDLLNPSFERIGGGFDQFFWEQQVYVETDYFESPQPPYCSQLISLLREDIEEFRKEARIESPYEVKNMWYERARSKQYHPLHDHGPKGYSCVLYVELDGKQKGTMFQDEVFKDKFFQFDVEEGDIIFFPSWLKHQASVNESENVRTIISWNTGRIAEKTQLYSEYEQYCTHV